MQAKADGFSQGTEEARVNMNIELERLKGDLQTEYETRFSQLDEEKRSLEPHFADLVIALVKKITGVVCENKREVILYLIGNAIRNLGKRRSLEFRPKNLDML